MKRLLTQVVILIALVLTHCDQYEFPETPYPTVVTDPVSGLNASSVSFNGLIRRWGTEAVTEHGFIWSTNADLTVDSGTVIRLGTLSDDTFTFKVNGSFPAKKSYFVRAFAITDSYTIYGDLVAFGRR